MAEQIFGQEDIPNVDNHNYMSVNEDGSIDAVSVSSLVPVAHDQIDLTYVATGNGEGEIETATYKLNTVTVAVLTLSYDASNRITSVVRT